MTADSHLQLLFLSFCFHFLLTLINNCFEFDFVIKVNAKIFERRFDRSTVIFKFGKRIENYIYVICRLGGPYSEKL